MQQSDTIVYIRERCPAAQGLCAHALTQSATQGHQEGSTEYAHQSTFTNMLQARDTHSQTLYIHTGTQARKTDAPGDTITDPSTNTDS